MEIKDLTPEAIERIFWKAMENGWGSGNVEKQTSPLLPGYKCIPFRSGEFYVLDAYCITPLNDKSAGTTTIWFNNVPVWVMHYGGEYPKHTIPFLKLALQSTIANQNFVGGRGPKHFTHEDYSNLSYRNTLASGMHDFSNFWGSECIFENGHNIGNHYYRGMILT